MSNVICCQDSRFNLLKLRPSQQSSWIGYALAYYFLKDFSTCLTVISEYRKTMMRVSGCGSCRGGRGGVVGVCAYVCC